jgi:hypothetical protein
VNLLFLATKIEWYLFSSERKFWFSSDLTPEIIIDHSMKEESQKANWHREWPIKIYVFTLNARLSFPNDWPNDVILCQGRQDITMLEIREHSDRFTRILHEISITNISCSFREHLVSIALLIYLTLFFLIFFNVSIIIPCLTPLIFTLSPPTISRDLLHRLRIPSLFSQNPIRHS